MPCAPATPLQLPWRHLADRVAWRTPPSGTHTRHWLFRLSASSSPAPRGAGPKGASQLSPLGASRPIKPAGSWVDTSFSVEARHPSNAFIEHRQQIRFRSGPTRRAPEDGNMRNANTSNTEEAAASSRSLVDRQGPTIECEYTNAIANKATKGSMCKRSMHEGRAMLQCEGTNSVRIRGFFPERGGTNINAV